MPEEEHAPMTPEEQRALAGDAFAETSESGGVDDVPVGTDDGEEEIEEDVYPVGYVPIGEHPSGEVSDEDYESEDEWQQAEAEAEAVDEAADSTYEEPEAAEWDEDSLSQADRALLAERRKRLTAQKKLSYYEQQAMRAKRSNWVESDGKRFPYLGPEDLTQIAEQAKSRRDFARLAKAHSARMQKAIEPHLERERARVRAEVQAAWGTPTTTGNIPSQSQRASDEVEKARETGDLTAVIKARLLGGQF